MSLAVKKHNGNLSLFSDFFKPMTWFDRDFFDLGSEFMPSKLGINVPTANITESPKEFKLELAAPGMEQKDFNIEIENDMLYISAEKEERKSEKDEEYSRKEYSFHSFSRSFRLPENIKEDDIKAKYENGILRITIPKEKETPVKPAHKIKVQ